MNSSIRLTTSLSLALACLTSLSAFAGYDKSWHKAEFWSGEYPNGVAVIKPGVRVKARAAMDKDAEPTIRCDLPYRAVFHEWNGSRVKANNVRFFTAAKIEKLVAKEDFSFAVDDIDAKPLAIKKGQIIEYLIYGAEGYFTVRIDGKEYGADMSLFDHVDGKAEESVYDEWIRLTCTNGKRVWLAVEDLYKVDGVLVGERNTLEYGRSRDLSRAEAETRAKQNP